MRRYIELTKNYMKSRWRLHVSCLKPQPKINENVHFLKFEITYCWLLLDFNTPCVVLSSRFVLTLNSCMLNVSLTLANNSKPYFSGFPSFASGNQMQFEYFSTKQHHKTHNKIRRPKRRERSLMFGWIEARNANHE